MGPPATLRSVIVGIGLLATPAFADCSALPAVTCDATSPNPYGAIIGLGPATASGASVTLDAGAQVVVQQNAINQNAISLGNNATITLSDGSLVQMTSANAAGLYKTGGNTIEFGSNSTLTIGVGAQVLALGTDHQGEAINPFGVNNVIINNGTIKAANAAAIWMQSNTGLNTIINNITGTIESDQSGGNVIGGGGSAVDFTNKGSVVGNINFGGGNDIMRVYTGSSTSGTINGGGGANSLFLNGAGSAALPAQFSKFQTLTKQDSGTWNVTQTLSSIGLTAVEVQQGTLVLSGANNPTYTGTMTVDSGAILQGDASGLPNTILDNGRVNFAQLINATYAGAIGGSGSMTKSGAGSLTLTGNNAYLGLTTVSQGTLQVSAPGNVGPGGIQIDAGATLSLLPAAGAGFTLNNALTGQGTLFARMGAVSDAFAFGASAGTAFAGTAELANGTFALSGANTAALAKATLQIDANNTTTIGPGVQAIGGLTLNGGKAIFNTSVPSDTVSPNSISTGSLTLNSGQVEVTIPNPATPPSTFAGPGSPSTLLQQDDGVLDRLISATSVTGSAGGVALVDQNGALVPASLLVNIAQGAGTDAIASYGYGLSSGPANNGLYVSYGLTQLNLLAGQTLDLSGDDGTLAGSELHAKITGPGNLTIDANNTITLNDSANNYTGATTVSGGTLALGASGALGKTSDLIVNAGAAANIGGTTQTVGALNIGGALDLAHGALATSTALGSGTLTTAAGSAVNIDGGALTVASGGSTAPGSLLGGGSLNLTGGALQINGSNPNLSASTAIASGATATLNDGAGLGNGAIADAGTLTFSGASGQLSNTVTGPGALRVINGSNVAATGAISNTGLIKIDAASALQIGNGGTSGSIYGNIIDDGSLRFDRSDVVAYAGSISGLGSVSQIGPGTTIFSGDSPYSGGTYVSAGTLGVTGALTNSVATVESGATLGGDGSVFGIVVRSGGTIAPGVLAPFSTLNVAGMASFEPGSVFLVNVNAAGQNDRLISGGVTNLSGASLRVVAANGLYNPATRYTLITAAGGVKGSFLSFSTTANLAFLSPIVTYDANDAYLGFVQTDPFWTAAKTPNEIATATALQQLPGNSALYSAIVGQGAAGALQAFDALSGEIHASAVSAAFDDSRLPREAVLDRLANPYGSLPGRGAAGFETTNTIAAPSPSQIFATWGQAFGSYGRIGGDGNAATLDRSLDGFVLGADATLDDHYRLGLVGGYTQATISVDARASSGRVASTYAGAYGGVSLEGLQVRGGAFYSYNRYDLNRTISFPNFGETASSAYGGNTLQAFGEVGWRVGAPSLARSTWIEPFVGALAMRIQTDSFTEAGGVSALTGESGNYTYGATTLGMRGQTAILDETNFLARGLLGWRHLYGGVTPASALAFASAPNVPFSILGAPIARDALMIEAGFDWRVSKTATLGVYYSGALAARDFDNAIKARFDMAF
jgi:fibronectin-binding autotransporter adhesin